MMQLAWSFCFFWVFLLMQTEIKFCLGLSTTTTTTTSTLQQGKSLKGCVCLVTGASRGIGKGIALELGAEGATVYITGTSSSSPGECNGDYVTSAETGGPGTIESTAAEVTKAGGIGIPIYCNHADDDNVQSVIDKISTDHGRLDILVNNAFRIPPGAPKSLYGKFWEQGLETWDTVHTVGLRSHFVSTCFSMPLLLKAAKEPHPSMKRPCIFMISSFGGLTYTFNLPYGVAKGAVDRMAKDMAIELEDQVCVTSLWPGLVDTERTQSTVESGDWDKYVGLPLDKAESPQFTGRAVVALAKDEENLSKTGTYQVVAELAEEYDFVDINGSRPPSIRSLRFLLPTYGMSEEQSRQIPESWIPDWKLPFWVMAQGKPPDS